MDSLKLLDISSFIIFSNYPWSLLVSFGQLFKLPLVDQCCYVICESPLYPEYLNVITVLGSTQYWSIELFHLYSYSALGWGRRPGRSWCPAWASSQWRCLGLGGLSQDSITVRLQDPATLRQTRLAHVVQQTRTAGLPDKVRPGGGHGDVPDPAGAERDGHLMVTSLLLVLACAGVLRGWAFCEEDFQKI